MTERRSNVRSGLFRAVVLQALDTGEIWHLGGYDISMEGISVRSKERLSDKYMYVASVKLGKSIFHAECSIVSHSTYKDKEHKVGLKFIDIDFDNLQVLKKFVK